MLLSRYFKLILQKLWVIILLEAVALGLTAWFTLNLTAYYSSTATLLLNPNVPNPLIPYINGTYASTLADNYTLVIKSDKFLSRVKEQLNSPLSTKELREAIITRLAPNTVVYSISARSTSPATSQAIASTIAKLFIADGLDRSSDNPGKPADKSQSSITATQRTELANVSNDIAKDQQRLSQLLAQTPSPALNDEIGFVRQTINSNLELRAELLVVLSRQEEKKAADPVSSATFLDDARLPNEPEANNLLRNLIFTGIIAALLGVIVIFAADYLDYTIRSSEQLALLTDLNNLGVVPLFRPARNLPASSFAADGSGPGPGPGLDSTLITVHDLHSSASEAYRAVRTNVLFSTIVSPLEQNKAASTSDAAFPVKTILITSTNSGEGKTLTAANLAVTFVQAGNRVILVDTDLRRPTSHSLFGIPNEQGFTNLIINGPEVLKTVLKPTPIPGLSLVTAGSLPPNPSELLTSPKAAQAVEALRKAADIIIFDSPPIGVVTDAAILANRVELVLLVVSWGSVRRDAVVKSVQSLRKVGANLAGTILNRSGGKADEGYYYNRAYGRKHKGDFGEEADQSEPSKPVKVKSGSKA